MRRIPQISEKKRGHGQHWGKRRHLTRGKWLQIAAISTELESSGDDFSIGSQSEFVKQLFSGNAALTSAYGIQAFIKSMSTSGEIISLVVSDSSPMGCQLLADALERASDRFKIVQRVHTMQDLLDAAAPGCDVVLISANLKDGALSGFHVLRELHNCSPALRPVMLLDVRDRELVIAAFRGGSRGVFFRAEPFSNLVKCIQCVHQGQIWAGNEELQFILEALTTAAPLKVLGNGSGELTKREYQIATHAAQGLTNREISRKLNLSEHTIKNHLTRIFEKLGVSSRVEMILHLTNRHQSAA